MMYDTCKFERISPLLKCKMQTFSGDWDETKTTFSWRWASPASGHKTEENLCMLRISKAHLVFLYFGRADPLKCHLINCCWWEICTTHNLYSNVMNHHRFTCLQSSHENNVINGVITHDRRCRALSVPAHGFIVELLTGRNKARCEHPAVIISHPHLIRLPLHYWTWWRVFPHRALTENICIDWLWTVEAATGCQVTDVYNCACRQEVQFNRLFGHEVLIMTQTADDHTNRLRRYLFCENNKDLGV